jgi:hypothetical protein
LKKIAVCIDEGSSAHHIKIGKRYEILGEEKGTDDEVLYLIKNDLGKPMKVYKRRFKTVFDSEHFDYVFRETDF